jgi:hypothetical protein
VLLPGGLRIEVKRGFDAGTLRQGLRPANIRPTDDFYPGAFIV